MHIFYRFRDERFIGKKSVIFFVILRILPTPVSRRFLRTYGMKVCLKRSWKASRWLPNDENCDSMALVWSQYHWYCTRVWRQSDRQMDTAQLS